MSTRRPYQIVVDSLDTHPAVQAWRAVMPQGALPKRIDAFCERTNWLLYALVGAGPGGSTIIAKRRRLCDALVERAVYEHVLPGLPIAAPDFYGSKQDGEFVWFLMQAVDGARYSESNPEHLAMAARWVAVMHTAATRLKRPPSLPDAGPDRFLAHLVMGRRGIQRSLRTSRMLDRASRVIFERIIAQLDRLEARWEFVSGLCHDAPATLVHCDFRPKNVFIRSDGTGLVAFDWETAGWGAPGPDLTRIDVVAYWQAVRTPWAVSLETVRRWALGGHVFQTLAAIDWESTELVFDTPETLAQPVASLNVLSRDLADFSESL